MKRIKTPRRGRNSPIPRSGTPCPMVDPDPFQAGAQAGMAAIKLTSMAAGCPTPNTQRWAQTGDIRFRLNAQHPYVRTMLAFSEAYAEAGGNNELLPHYAAVERFFALITFLQAEQKCGRVASWPKELKCRDERGALAIANTLVRAAATADLAWDRPFKRDHLLAGAIA